MGPNFDILFLKKQTEDMFQNNDLSKYPNEWLPTGWTTACQAPVWASGFYLFTASKGRSVAWG